MKLSFLFTWKDNSYAINVLWRDTSVYHISRSEEIFNDKAKHSAMKHLFCETFYLTHVYQAMQIQNVNPRTTEGTLFRLGQRDGF